MKYERTRNKDKTKTIKVDSKVFVNRCDSRNGVLLKTIDWTGEIPIRLIGIPMKSDIYIHCF